MLQHLKRCTTPRVLFEQDVDCIVQTARSIDSPLRQERKAHPSCLVDIHRAADTAPIEGNPRIIQDDHCQRQRTEGATIMTRRLCAISASQLIYLFLLCPAKMHKRAPQACQASPALERPHQLVHQGLALQAVDGTEKPLRECEEPSEMKGFIHLHYSRCI